MSYNFGSGTAVYGQYILLDTRDSDSALAPPGGSLWGTWLHANSLIDDNDVTSAEMSYDFDHDVFDLGIRKWMEVGSDLGMQIEAGLRYANMTPEYRYSVSKSKRSLHG